MTTKTVNTELWNRHKFLDNIISNGDEIVCEVVGSTAREMEEKRDLIVTAVNACKAINPDNPLAVAKTIVGVFEALKSAYNETLIPNAAFASNGQWDIKALHRELENISNLLKQAGTE